MACVYAFNVCVCVKVSVCYWRMYICVSACFSVDTGVCVCLRVKVYWCFNAAEVFRV